MVTSWRRGVIGEFGALRRCQVNCALSARPLALPSSLVMSLACPHCHTSIHERNVDRTRDIATCQACGWLVDLRARPPVEPENSAAGSAAPRQRPAVPLPPGIAIAEESSQEFGYRGTASSAIVLTRRWLRKKHFVMLAGVLAASAGVAYLWINADIGAPLIVGSLMLLFWSYALVTMFVNSTTVRAGGGLEGRIDVRHGPLPYLGWRNRSIAAAEVRQLYVAKYGLFFSVEAMLADGTTIPLVRPLVTADQALFVEQQLERVLGLADYPVVGEIDHPTPIPVAGAPLAAGGAYAAVLGPVIAIGAVGLALFMTRTEVSGSLSAGEDLGGWEFTPDDCGSGQLQGFFGVELTAKDAPGVRIRFAHDAVRGNLAIVEHVGPRPGKVVPNGLATSQRTTIASDGCRKFELTVARTNTSINDVRVVEGTANLDCDALSGSVTFAGCH
jgi:hypothetical protein